MSQVYPLASAVQNDSAAKLPSRQAVCPSVSPLSSADHQRAKSEGWGVALEIVQEKRSHLLPTELQAKSTRGKERHGAKRSVCVNSCKAVVGYGKAWVHFYPRPAGV